MWPAAMLLTATSAHCSKQASRLLTASTVVKVALTVRKEKMLQSHYVSNVRLPLEVESSLLTALVVLKSVQIITTRMAQPLIAPSVVHSASTVPTLMNV